MGTETAATKSASEPEKCRAAKHGRIDLHCTLPSDHVGWHEADYSDHQEVTYVIRWTTTRAELTEALQRSITPLIMPNAAEVADEILSRLTPAATDADARTEMEALAALTAPEGTAPDVVLRSLPARWRVEAAATGGAMLNAGDLAGLAGRRSAMADCADELADILLAIDGDTAASDLLASNPEPGRLRKVLAPPLPDGQFGRIELQGYRQHTGWITEEARFGGTAAVVRDWDGREVAACWPGPGCRVVYLPTPLKRPDAEPEPQLAIAAGEGFGYRDDDDVFDTRSDSGGPF